MRLASRCLSLCASTLFLVGCPGVTPTTSDGGATDSGFEENNFDAGPTPADAGERPDATTCGDACNVGADAGPHEDAGMHEDAGVHEDAGNRVDAGTSNGHAIKTVFIILEENENFDAFKGSSSAPYINNTLLPESSYATKYSNPAGNHPSLPNYLWLEAGTNFGVTADGDPSQYGQTSTQHLVTLLSNAGVTWKAYEESIDGSTCPVGEEGGGNGYAAKHDPMVFFSDTTNDFSATSANCISHVRPYTELATDLANGTVAQYNFITPNLCDDGHNDCLNPSSFTPTSDEVSQTDTWLKNNVPMILSSNAYKDGGVLFITWDESEPSLSCAQISPQCPIGMIVLSYLAKGGGYSNAITYDHSSTLRTMEEIFSVSPFLGGAATATDLSDLFQTFP